jgi:DNA-binding response OmpR family regulator
MPKKILIVEDENDIRDIYTEVLKAAGYEVIQANDGDEGWRMIQESDWDLLFLDIMLPKRDGLEVLESIVNTEGVKRGPIILLTNLERESIVQKSLELGAQEYLVKSNIDPQKVVDTVRKYFPNDSD